MTKIYTEDSFEISSDLDQSEATATRFLEYNGFCLGEAELQEDGQWKVTIGKNYTEDGCEDDLIGFFNKEEAEDKLWEARWIAKGNLNLEISSLL